MNILFGLEQTSCVLQDEEEMNEKFTETVNLEDLCDLRDQIQGAYINLKGEITIEGLHMAKKILQDILYKEEFYFDFRNND